MKAKMRRAVLAVAAVMAAGTAAAGVPDPWGLYIGADAGRTRFNVSSGQLDELLGITPGSSQLQSSDLGYSLMVGFRFTENLAVEASWVDLGTTRYRTSGQGALSIDSRGPTLAGLFTIPLNSALALEARVGMYFNLSRPRGYLNVDLGIGSGGIEVVAIEGEGGADPAGILGAGVAWSPNRYLSIHVSYEYFADKNIDLRHSGTTQTLNTTGNRMVAAARLRF